MNSEGLSLLIGLVMPPVIELIKRKLPDNRKAIYAVSLGTSALVGLIASWFNGELLLSQADVVLGSIGAAMIASQTVYNVYWKNSKLESRIAKVK